MWSSSRQNIVFDTFYWGFIVAHVPAGWLAQRFGGKRVFGGFLLAGSLSTALIPIASRTHFYLLLVLRFLGGVGSVSDEGRGLSCSLGLQSTLLGSNDGFV